MSTARRQDVDALYDRRYHNQPENVLGSNELAIVEAGRVAMSSLTKTLMLWLTVGDAFKVLEDKANRLNLGRKTFQRLMRQNGFSMDGPEKVIDKSMVSKLLKVVEHKADVIKWHEGLTPKQKREWAAPNTVMLHCPIFAKPKPEDEDEPKLTKAQQTEQELMKALERVDQLEKQLKLMDGDTFNYKTSSPKEIAQAVVGNLQPYAGKAEKVAKTMLTLLKGSAVINPKNQHIQRGSKMGL